MTYKKAPEGFSREQWKTFMENGILILENAISNEDIDFYLNAIDQSANADPNYDDKLFFGPEHAVSRSQAFSNLIDHPRHVGYAYDIYGELLKLHLSQFFIRPQNSSINHWHQDGARVVPYSVYTGIMPMQIKIGYWLTDTEHSEMGNFVYIPGSHKYSDPISQYGTSKKHPKERILKVKAGTMTIMHCDLWHRVEPNHSTSIRKNIFLAYCPSWVCEADRFQCSEEWLSSLTREQRIIMRSYSGGYDRTRPPSEDFPLFLDRNHKDHNDNYAHLELKNRRRRLKIEEFMNPNDKQ